MARNSYKKEMDPIVKDNLIDEPERLTTEPAYIYAIRRYPELGSEESWVFLPEEITKV